MIFDAISQLSNYRYLHPRLAEAIDYILNNDLQSLPFGQSVIKGQELFLNYTNSVFEEKSSSTYEYHKEYADIHIILEGSEKIFYGDEKGNDIKPYDSDNDFALAQSQVIAELLLRPGYFIVFFPEEKHQPGGQVLKDEQVKKVVFKVRMTDDKETNENRKR